MVDPEAGDTTLDLKIEKVDAEVNCIRINRVAGSKLDFLRIYQDFKDKLMEGDAIL